MMGTAHPNHKPLRGKSQTNRIINHTHSRGSHNPKTNPNYSNYKLGIRATIIWSIIIFM